MKKKIFIGIAVFFVLFIGILIALPFLFKDKINQMIKDEASKNLRAKMDYTSFDLSLIKSFPNFTFELNDFSLVGIEEFEKDTLASIKNFVFTIDLMSVINGDQIKIKTIKLNEPRIKAIVLKGGKANWDITIPSEEQAPETASEPSKFSLTLNNYEINNAYVVYDDRDGNMYAELVNLNHSGEGDFTQDLFTLVTNTSIDALTYKMDGITYLNKVNTRLKFDIDIDNVRSKYTFKENELQLNELFLGFDGFVAMPTETIEMDMTYFAKKTDFKNLLSLVPAVYAKDFASVQTSGKLGLDGYVKGKYNEATNSMPAFGLKLLVDNAMFKYPDLPKAVNNINIDLRVDNPDGNPDKTVIDIKKFHVEMAENPVDIRMLIKTPVSDPYVNGEIKGKVILSSVKEFIPLEEGQSLNGTIVSDVTLKGNVSALEKEQYDKFEFAGQLMVLDMDYKSKDLAYDVNLKKMYLNFSPKIVELSALEAKIGKSDINASGKMEQFLEYALKDDGVLKGNFIMNSTLMDLNEFMTEEESATTTTTTEEETPLSVIEVPGNINFKMNTNIGKLIYDNIEMTNVSGAVSIADSKVSLDNLKMNLLDGVMTMRGYYETKDVKKPGIDFYLDIANFDIQKTVTTFNTVEKMAPIAKTAFGKFSTQMSVTGYLDEKMEPVLNSLTGGGKLSTNSVVIQNFEPTNKIADALKMDQFKKLALNNINVSFKFKDGRVQVDPTDIKFGDISGKVGGSNGFDQTIDYVWSMNIPRSRFGGAANAVLNNLTTQAAQQGINANIGEIINVDIFIGGTVQKPTIKTNLHEKGKDAMESIKEQVKEKVEEKVKEVVEDAKAKASAEAEKILKDAQAKADQIKAEGKRLADQIRSEANAQAQKIESQAKNPLEKAAAKAAADKVRKEGEEKAKKVENEANTNADNVMNEARKKADALK
ncbi:MAG: AsmA-like C-terminal region-containing protein [Bacteroidia bacterium]